MGLFEGFIYLYSQFITYLQWTAIGTEVDHYQYHHFMLPSDSPLMALKRVYIHYMSFLRLWKSSSYKVTSKHPNYAFKHFALPTIVKSWKLLILLCRCVVMLCCDCYPKKTQTHIVHVTHWTNLTSEISKSGYRKSRWLTQGFKSEVELLCCPTKWKNVFDF